MNAEVIKTKERLDFLLSDLSAARQQELFNAGHALAIEIQHHFRLLALLQAQEKQESAWSRPLPNIRPLTNLPVRFL